MSFYFGDVCWAGRDGREEERGQVDWSKVGGEGGMRRLKEKDWEKGEHVDRGRGSFRVSFMRS